MFLYNCSTCAACLMLCTHAAIALSPSKMRSSRVRLRLVDVCSDRPLFFRTVHIQVLHLVYTRPKLVACSGTLFVQLGCDLDVFFVKLTIATTTTTTPWHDMNGTAREASIRTSKQCSSLRIRSLCML